MPQEAGVHGIARGSAEFGRLLSIPIAFVNPTLALLSWFVLAPVGALINRRMPPDVRAYFGQY